MAPIQNSRHEYAGKRDKGTENETCHLFAKLMPAQMPTRSRSPLPRRFRLSSRSTQIPRLLSLIDAEKKGLHKPGNIFPKDAARSRSIR